LKNPSFDFNSAVKRNGGKGNIRKNMGNMESLKITDIAKMIDHSILHPAFSDIDLVRECEIAKKYNVATVCVKPFHTKRASELVRASNVGVCSVIGFPHGNSSTDIKIQETLQVIFYGADEVDMVVNIGKVLQGDWDYVEKEIFEINQACISNDAILKVIFENDFLPDDKTKITLCEICSRVKVAFVKTSTGYGFKKNENGLYFYNGATEHDLILMREHCSPEIQIKAAGGVRTLDDILKVKMLGVSRVGATATASIMEEAKKLLD
jgi:deoxyribose-phosphate aldolase